MKKFIVLILVMLFTAINAEATTTVFYGNAGRPIYRSHGAAYRTSANRFGSNAAFTPANRTMAGRSMRMGQYQKAITRSVAVSSPRNCSTLNRNYVPHTATSSYTRNGITYYN